MLYRSVLQSLKFLCLFALFSALTAQSAVVFDRGSSWKYFVGTTEASSPVTAWRQVSFDDSSWQSGPTPIGYGEPEIVTGIPSSNAGNWTSVYLRKTFVIGNPAGVDELELFIRIDDGYVAYVNGVEVNRQNAPGGELAFNATASSAGEPVDTTITITNASTILVEGTNVVAIHALNANLTSSDLVVDASLTSSVDTLPPVVVLLNPPATSTVRDLIQIEVLFDEAVANADASDLLINGVPADDLTFGGPGQLIFTFAQPPTGRVDVAWAPNNGITDLAPVPNAFGGGSWFYTLDPNAEPPGVIISEFMASNDDTLNDEDGDDSDWIEIFNAGNISASIGGWYLTDDPADLTKWRIPSVTLLPNTYKIIFASGKDRTSPFGQLHTSFQLTSDAGGYLALVDSLTNVVSEFVDYPEQFEDVSYGRDRVNPSVVGYFPTPTPGTQNAPGGAGFAPEVEFSFPSRTFTSSFLVTLSTPSPTAVIRYTMNNTVPTPGSPIYSGPIQINGTTRLRTRAFEPGLLPGPPRTEYYIQLDSSVLSASSDIPLVILHNFGGGSVPSSGEQFVVMMIFEPNTGRSSMVNLPDLTTRGRFRLRGSSTQNIAKGSFAFEAWDEFNDDKNIAPLGMPPESDWVLYAPNQFDPVLIHNSFMYELSNEVGRYASRTRFFECYLKDNSGTPGAVTSSDYNGVYLMIEKVKRDRNRVDIDNLQPEHVQPPEVTGGYLMKIDRRDPGDGGFSAAGQGALNYVDPKEEEIESTERDPQQQYLLNYLNSFGAALNGPNYTDPELGFWPYVNPLSLIDHHILNVFSENADAFRLSTYLYKPRNGPLEYGPVWDFDRSLESKSDNRDDNPSVWHDGGTDFFNYTWWGRMLSDTNFWQLWVDRWQELQDGPMNLTNLQAKIDRQADEVRESQVREDARWSHTDPRGSYQNEVNIMKNWVTARVNFINGEFLERPDLSNNGGDISAGLQVSMSAPEGGTLYYTLNGIDPRASAGGLSPSAQVYRAPIVINSNTRLLARAFDPSHSNLSGGDNPRVSTSWSGLTKADYLVSTPPLVITEIMYNPAPPAPGDTNQASNFEFIELKNISGSGLALNGFRFVNGIQFDFTGSDVTVLGPGQHVLVVKNRGSFIQRYGALPNIAGEYSGSLDNGGERVELIGPIDEPVHDFRYDDDWFAITDGLGFSLVILDENGARGDWDRKSGWRISGSINGSPGADDTPPPGIPQVVVNEALTHTDLPQIDAVELYNPTGDPADVSGWFLTDDLAQPIKYVIPPGTVIPAGDYWVAYETNFNRFPGLPGNFSLSSKGEEIYLFSGNGLDLSGYVQGYEFGAAANGVSFGRYITSTGADQFTAMQSVTLGGPNGDPVVGPVVISEIMYHADSGSDGQENPNLEFVELRNLGPTAIPLYDIANSTNTWRLRRGVEYDFPAFTSIPGNGRLLVVGFDPATNSAALFQFRLHYGAQAGLTFRGPYEGRLNNASDTVQLLRPDSPEPPPDPDAGVVPFIVVDEVKYSDNSPWPLAADGIGASLQRVVDTDYGNDPVNWVAAKASPGLPYPGGTPPVITTQPQSQTVVAFTEVTFNVLASGIGPFTYQWRFNGVNLDGANSPSLTLTNIQPSQGGAYQVVVLNAANSVDSEVAQLSVVVPASIFRQPQSFEVAPGTNVTFTVEAGSSTPITYQWRKDGIPIPGATQAVLSILDVQEEDDGFYDVAITDAVGTIFSAPGQLAVLVPPIIVQPPISQSVAEGGSVTLSIKVRGTLPMGFRWRRSFFTITNFVLFERESFFTIENFQPSDATVYTVVLTNRVNYTPGILSPGATLTLLADTDGDGMSDDYENANSLNPNDPNDLNSDNDLDGLTNGEEHIAGTDPNDENSFLRIENIVGSIPSVRIGFNAVSNKTYTLQYTDSLEAGPDWKKLEDISASPVTSPKLILDPFGVPERYYRLVTPRVP